MLSLISVNKTHSDGKVSGSFVQHACGDLQYAIDKAIKTEEANGNKLDIAVVEEIIGGNILTGCGFSPKKRLDTRRITRAYPAPKTIWDDLP